jgi:hypothetical protein
VYHIFIDCDQQIIRDRQFNLAAEKLGRDRENIRQNVAKVQRKLGINKDHANI